MHNSISDMLRSYRFLWWNDCFENLARSGWMYAQLWTTTSLYLLTKPIATFSTMVGGVLSDIFHAEDRNTAMALFSGGTFFGTGLGPLVSGFVAKNTSWRWVFYVQAIMAAVVFLALVLGLEESRGSVLLSRKAKVLNKYYEELESKGHYGLVFSSDGEKQVVRRVRWKVKSDEERESLAIMLKISTTRPFCKFTFPTLRALVLTVKDLLFTEPVVFLFSLWITFAWSILYLQFDSIPIVFSINHGFDIQQSAVVFTGMYFYETLAVGAHIFKQCLSVVYSPLSSVSARRSWPNATTKPRTRRKRGCMLLVSSVLCYPSECSGSDGPHSHRFPGLFQLSPLVVPPLASTPSIWQFSTTWQTSTIDMRVLPWLRSRFVTLFACPLLQS